MYVRVEQGTYIRNTTDSGLSLLDNVVQLTGVMSMPGSCWPVEHVEGGMEDSPVHTCLCRMVLINFLMTCFPSLFFHTKKKSVMR